MRIIGGVARGRRLKAPDTMATRPVTDRAREAVFSMIGGWVEGADVIDLYAGSGAFGLEALSRGATSVTFVESGRRALTALRANIDDLALGPVTVVEGRVEDFLSGGWRGRLGPFDLAFMDPPWEQSSTVMSAQMAALDPILAPGAEIVLSRRHSDPSPVSPETWRVATDRRYGDTRILRYEKPGEPE